MFSGDFAPYVAALLTIAGIHIPALISPGPDFVLIVRNSLMYSRRSGIFAALGVTTGIAMHTTYTLFGLGLLMNDLILNIIRVLGALYLVYIGYRSFKADFNTSATLEKKHHEEDLTPFQAFRSGFFCNALNPMVIVLFVTIFSSVLDLDTPLPIKGLYALEIIGLSFLWFGMVAFFITFDKIQEWVNRFNTWVQRATGSALIFFGIKVALTITP